MEQALPGLMQTSQPKDQAGIQQKIEDFFQQDDNVLLSLLSQSSSGSQKLLIKQSPIVQSEAQSFFSKSNSIKGKKGDTYPIKEISEHKTIKGSKGFQYKVQWLNHEPTWEPEILLKENAEKLLNQYWRQATQSNNEQNQHIALNVMQITNKPLKTGTPQLSQICSQDPGNGVIVYDEIENAFLANIGNWKKMRRQDNKDIYKCSECDAKLEVEKKGSQFRVKAKNNNNEIHNWFDINHLTPFNEQNSENNRSERLHTSIESFIKLSIRNGICISPDDILDIMKRERPLLFRYFKPSIEQLTYFIVSNNRDLVVVNQGTPGTPDIKRITRSSKNSTPSEKYPEFLEAKKRDSKNKNKKIQFENKLEKILATLQDSVDEEDDIKEKPKVTIEVQSSNNEEEKSQPPSSCKKKNSSQKKQKPALAEKVEIEPIVENICSKRVKFNQFIEQCDFIKTQSEDEEQINSQQNNNFSSQESAEDGEQQDIVYENVSSDEEDYQSGAFLEFIKQETERADKERSFLMKELKVKERRGSIFIDKVKKVVAAVQRSPGKYDFLIEWDYNNHDKITPSSTLVRGSHFVFSHPLLYRRYIEKNFVDTKGDISGAISNEGVIIKK